MSNFEAARTNMVDCQINTNGVIQPHILGAFGSIPREKFLPESKQGIAYQDNVIEINKDAFLLDPMAHARLVLGINPQETDITLTIGSGNGYSAAILSSLTTTVIALENRQQTIDKATETLEGININNVAFVKNKLTEGCSDHAPFNGILLCGSVATTPTDLIKQLAPNGRMAFILKPSASSIGKATLITRGAGDHYSEETLFETSAPYLSGFEPQEQFTF